MQNNLLILASVALIESVHHLRKNAPNKVLLDILALIVVALLLAAILNKLREVTSLAQLHDQIDRSVLFVHKFVIAPHYMLRLDLPQDLDLVVKLLAFLLAHIAIVCHFPHHLFTTWYVEDFCHFPKTAYTYINKFNIDQKMAFSLSSLLNACSLGHL